MSAVCEAELADATKLQVSVEYFSINLLSRKNDFEIQDLDCATELDSQPLAWHEIG